MKKLNTYLYDQLKNLPHDLLNLIISYSKNNNIRTAFVGGFLAQEREEEPRQKAHHVKHPSIHAPTKPLSRAGDDDGD